MTPLAISHQRGQKDLVHLLSDWTGSPPGMMTSPSRNSPPDLSSPSSGTISPTPVSQYSDIRPKLPNNNNFGPFANGGGGGLPGGGKPPMNKRKRKSTKTNGQAPKEKQPATSMHQIVGDNNQKPHNNNHSHNNFLMNDLFPSPRSTIDKRDVCLPDACLSSGDLLDAMYSPLDQINSLPSTWGPSVVGGGVMHQSHPGNGGHPHQYNNNAIVSMRAHHYQFQPQQPVQTFAPMGPYEPLHQNNGMRSYPTPPTPIAGMDSPNGELGSPLDQLNVIPSPFLTPSPESWSHSPGNSENSG